MNTLLNKVRNLGKRHDQQAGKPLAEPELLSERPLPMVGLFALLDENQKREALNFHENESFGDKALSRISA